MEQMKASELKLCNYVYDDEDVVVQVRMLLDQSYKDYDIGTPVLFSKEGDSKTLYYSDIKAIPLTSEWLLMFGFKTANDTYYEKDGIGLITGYAVDGTFVCGNSFGSRHTHFYYVHQLQNLYFALTGEELTIKETK